METTTVAECDICGSTALRDIDTERALMRCEICTFVFDSPRPTLEALVSYYSQPGKYDQWLVDFPQRRRLWNRRLRKLRPNARQGSILDVGTGIGQFLDIARDSFTSVHGTEVSTSAIELAEQQFGLCIDQGTLEEIDFGGRRFENITLFHVLEHVPSPASLLKRCHELLADGGMLFIAVPNDDPSAPSDVPLRRIVLDGSMDEIHLSHFSECTLTAIIERNGFRVIDLDLDPYFVVSNPYREVKQVIKYRMFRLIRQWRGRNSYPALWCAAQKRGGS